jgi:hypothetical protein
MNQYCYKIFSPLFPLKGKLASKLFLLAHLVITPLMGQGVIKSGYNNSKI